MTQQKYSLRSFCSVVVLLIIVSAGVAGGQTPSTSSGQVADIEQAKQQVFSLIQTGKLAGADSATTGIMGMPDSKDKGQALQQIAGKYQQAKEYDRAIKLCDYVLKGWPKGDFAIWAQMSKALSQLYKGDITAANKTTDGIINNYANDPNLALTLSIIADGYTENKMDQKAREIREGILDKTPEGIWVAGTEAISLINQKGYSIALRRVDSIIKDFNGNPELAGMLFRIGQEFCWKSRYGEAKDVFDRVIKDLPSNSVTQKARLWSATANVCFLIKQSKDDEASASIDKLIKDFEVDAGLPEAVYRVGQEFEWTKGAVGAGSAEYNASAKVYRRLLEGFSQTSYGKLADWDYKRLTYRINILALIEKDDTAGADAAIEKMISEFTDKTKLAGEIFWIAMWSNEHKKYDRAQNLYERIITDYHSGYEYNQAFWGVARIVIDADESANRTVEDTIAQLKMRFENTGKLSMLLHVAGGVYQGKASKAGLPEEEKELYLEKAIRLFTEAGQIAGPGSDMESWCLEDIEKCKSELQSAPADK